ncbi:MAG: hypothetical protein ABH821_03370 [archaeon]
MYKIRNTAFGVWRDKPHSVAERILFELGCGKKRFGLWGRRAEVIKHHARFRRYLADSQKLGPVFKMGQTQVFLLFRDAEKALNDLILIWETQGKSRKVINWKSNFSKLKSDVNPPKKRSNIIVTMQRKTLGEINKIFTELIKEIFKERYKEYAELMRYYERGLK